MTRLLLVAACLAGTATTAAAEPLRIAGADYLGDAPTVIAEARGLFAAQGLHVEVTHESSGKAGFERLRAGSSDFALMAPTPIVIDALADDSPGGRDDPVILASLVHSTDLIQLVTLSDSGIERPAELQGRRVAIRRGTNTEFVWHQLAQYHGIDPTTVELVDLPFVRMAEALLAGVVDAAILWEPWTSNLEARAALRPGLAVRHFDLRYVYAGKWLLVTTRGLAADRPADCRAVLRAYRDAIEYMERRPGEAQALFARRTVADPDLLTQHWAALDYNLNLDWSLIAALQEELLWARGRAPEAAHRAVSVLDLIETEPLRAIARAVVGIPVVVDDEDSAQ